MLSINLQFFGGRGGSSTKSSGNTLASANASTANLDVHDVADAEGYFSGTTLRVTEDLSAWLKDADKKYSIGGNSIMNYINDSSINDRLQEAGYNWESELSSGDKKMVQNLDKWIGSTALAKDTILYSGLNSEKIDLFNSAKSTVSLHSYLSTSPDPIYAGGYASDGEIPTVLKIKASAGTKVGKTYFEGTTSTEGVLGRNSKFRKTGSYKAKIMGETVNIIEVSLT